jgi:hypothetical protein
LEASGLNASIEDAAYRLEDILYRPARVNGALWVPQPSPQYGEMHAMQTKNKQPPVGVRSQDNPPAAPKAKRLEALDTVPIRYETSKERQACNLFAQIPLQVTEI